MTEHVIRLHGVTDLPTAQVQSVVPSFTPGCFVAAYDATATGLAEGLVCTTYISQALVFPTFLDAMSAYREVGVPLVRPDGRMNRPLTAFTAEFVKVDG